MGEVSFVDVKCTAHAHSKWFEDPRFHVAKRTSSTARVKIQQPAGVKLQQPKFILITMSISSQKLHDGSLDGAQAHRKWFESPRFHVAKRLRSTARVKI
ncbi:hypothetical protein AMTRI_Chr09g37030 [Amborella trichopoda]